MGLKPKQHAEWDEVQFDSDAEDALREIYEAVFCTVFDKPTVSVQWVTDVIGSIARDALGETKETTDATIKARRVATACKSILNYYESGCSSPVDFLTFARDMLSEPLDESDPL